MKDLFEYNAKCNEIYAHYILEANLAHKKIIQLFSHIQNAHQIWNERILGETASIKPRDMIVMRDAFEINKLNFKTTKLILEEKSLNEIVSYKNSKGESFSSTVEEILFHVINHSTHHRAQIGTLLPKFGIQPPITDYIAYKRSLSKT